MLIDVAHSMGAASHNGWISVDADLQSFEGGLTMDLQQGALPIWFTGGWKISSGWNLGRRGLSLENNRTQVESEQLARGWN